ncbi:MAG: TonB family protein [Fibromonadaceae bacterium]|jgi:TonB family protein|nr:TonB family protein [Fibromonadaceae bacterium]
MQFIRAVLILLMLWSLCFSEAPGLNHSPTNFPEITFKIQEVIGSYSEKKIEAIVDSNMLGLRSVYYKYIDRGQDIEGDILLKFTITANGKASNIDILSSTTGNAEFDEAIKNKAAIWKWETTRGDKPTSVTLLFRFVILHSSSLYFILSSPYPPEKVHWIMNTGFNMNTRILAYLWNVYVAFHKSKPDLKGKIILKYTISDSGEVIKVDIVASTTEWPPFDEAIKNKFASSKKWKLKDEKENYKSGNTTFMREFTYKWE